MTKRPVLFVLLLCLAFSAMQPARADNDDLDRLREAVRRGDVMPLSALREQVSRKFPGDIIKVELDEDDGRFIYEFKILQRNGRLLEIEMDAKDGRVLDIDHDD